MSNHLHSSTRRPQPLKDSDCDHEIILVDHADSLAPNSAEPASDRLPSPGQVSDSSSRNHSDVPLRKHSAGKKHLRREMTRRKYGKYKTRPIGEDGSYEAGDESTSAPESEPEDGAADGTHEDEVADPEANGESSQGANLAANKDVERGRARAGRSKHTEHESAIDILYENERGGFLCGIPLFASKALGSIDSAPWTNSGFKTSATNPTNAQVPDPSWEWAWKEWSINHDDYADEEGWEYSFAFSKKFSWHGPTWWNSFVRRRAWIRMRVRKHEHPHVQEAHMLNEDYFTIHPAKERSRSRSTFDGGGSKRQSVVLVANREIVDEMPEDITNIGSLMKALRLARIDREIMELVENFIKNGGDELYYMRERMHDVMRLFIFQASRRLLLSHLLKIFNEAIEQQKDGSGEANQQDASKSRRIENLEAALKHADEEVRKLEFWSDIKDMAEKGETKGAVDENQGWDDRWAGIDRSGPSDVISDKNAVGKDDCEPGKGNGALDSVANGNKGKGKGKGKEQ